MPKRWIIPPASPDCQAAARRWGVPPLVAQLLINRGLTTDQPCEAFLAPSMKDLHPPERLPGAPDAAARIVEAIRSKTPIVLYGDYDVDGTTGVAILWHILRQGGGEVAFYVPHRLEEGYGLNMGAVRRLVEDGAGMIVSVDCGITAVEVAGALREAGVQLIITDHHTPKATIPQADVIVHPTVGGTPDTRCQAEPYPNPHLCGAGVAFKLAWAVARQLCGSERVHPEYRQLLLELLPLAALGTIADIVPLSGENRIIVKHGLSRLASSALPGLQALIESAGLRGDRISGYDVGFKLAPRINAAGRMGHARLAVELFTRADKRRGQEIALYLEEHNRSRQAIERRIAREAYDRIERDGLASDARRAIVLASEGWHAGVIGIVAARIVDRYHRPTVVIAIANGEGQGSARSIRHFDLADALAACTEHLLSHGGHNMAAGIRIAPDRIEPFTEAFVEVANRRLTGDDLIPKLRLDAEVPLDALAMSCVEMIIGLGPFGMGNPRPKLATDWVELAAEPRCVGRSQEHLQVSFRQGGAEVKGIGFGLAASIEDLKQHRRCRVAFEPIINEFNGRRSVEMQILDMQFSK